MNTLTVVVAASILVGTCHASNLCSVNPYTKAEAEQGRIAFNSHCAFCHQYSMVGREPGNAANESPDIKILSEGDLRMVDGNGGLVPPLVGAKFFNKWRDKTFTDFSSTVSSASISFPTKDFGSPKTFFLIAGYVLERNCGKLR